MLYLVYVHRSALQGTGDSVWSLISGIFEALTRILFAKGIFVLVGVPALFWSEPFSWLTAWLFVFVPYVVTKNKRYPIEKERAV